MTEQSPIKTFREKFDMLSEIRDIARSGPIKSVRWCGFNGGSTLNDLIRIVKPALAEDFKFEVLTWDLRTSDLLPKERFGEDAHRRVRSLETVLGNLEMDEFGTPYTNPSEIFSEYLMLGSEVLRQPGHQHDFLNGISKLLLQLQGTAEKKAGTVLARKAPHYVPCLFIAIDDQVFVRMYTDTVLGLDDEPDIYLMTDSSNVLHRVLNAHFSKVWSEASGNVCEPFGSGAHAELEHWDQHKQAREDREAERMANTPKIFISYRQNDTSWACTRLYEHLAMIYGRASVFLDNESIPTASNYEEVIPARAKAADIMLVVMGEHWASEENLDKLHLRTVKQDFVRDELEIALNAENDIRVLPVLVDTDAFPAPSDLPDSVAGFVKFNNGKHLNWKNFRTSVKEIVGKIDDIWVEIQAKRGT